MSLHVQVCRALCDSCPNPLPSLTCGHTQGAPDHPTVLADRLPMHLRSLHIWGTEDTAVDCSRSRSLRDKWLQHVNAPVTVEHGSGHCIPTQAAFLNQYRDFMEAALKSTDAALPPARPPPALAAADVSLLRPGCVVVADNVLSFGVPLTDYLDHVRATGGPYACSLLREGQVEYSAVGGAAERGTKDELMLDGVEISVLR